MQFGNCCLLIWLLICTSKSTVYVNGDYILEIRTHSYNNPSNRCTGCGSNQGCCDDFNVFQCTGSLRCDNYFHYCLRTFGTFRFNTDCDNGQFSNSSERDGGMINFSQDVILGLPNPLPLNGISNAWNGAQLFLEIFDNDTDIGSDDDLVDRFLIDISSSLPVGVESSTFTFTGNFATIVLSSRVVCAPGFTGDVCQTNIDDCNGITCSDNGRCIDGVDSFQCDCNPGFTGTLCDMNINDCAGINCNGNGRCIDGVDSFRCDCNPGFTGTLCDMNINDCAGINCNGNGRCIDGVDSFRCDCNLGFTGTLCDMNIDDCSGMECSGNGQCVDGINNFTCTCDSGFTGELCEMNINDCIGRNCSGNGQCEDGLNSFVCVCSPGFTGEFCSTIGDSGGDGSRSVGPNTGAIAGGVIGGLVILLLLLLVIIVSVMLIVRRQKIKEEQTYKPDHPLPGDNPVYDVTSDPSNVIPIAASSTGADYVNLNHNTTVASPPDHDFQNPLYGSPIAPNIPSSTNNSTNVHATAVGSTEHDFENPIYESGTYDSPTAAHTEAVYAIPEEPEHYEYLSETVVSENHRNQQ